jgi:aspartate/methionine/tyrosine aminotransferase
MSKSLALPGLRIGWLATRLDGLLARCQAYKDYTTICSSAPSEVLAIIGLRARDRILARNLAIIRNNLAVADGFFSAKSDLFRWLPPRAGSVAFPEWMGSGTVDEFCDRAVRHQGVMVVPGSLFDAEGQHFRIGLGRKNFPEALRRLGDLF